MTEITANYTTSIESDITDTSQVTSAITLTELTGTDTVFQLSFIE